MLPNLLPNALSKLSKTKFRRLPPASSVRRAPHGERRAFAQFAGYFDRSAVGLDDGLGDCEAEAATPVCTGTGFIDAIKALENMREIVRGNASPRISHDERDHIRPRLSRD